MRFGKLLCVFVAIPAALVAQAQPAATPAPGGAQVRTHSRIGNVSNAPETYLLDGKQYLLVAAGDMLAAFAIYGSQ